MRTYLLQDLAHSYIVVIFSVILSYLLPKELPPAPTALTAEAADWEAGRPLNDLQENWVKMVAKLNHVPVPGITTQGQVSAWTHEHFTAFRTRVLAARKQAP